MIGLLQTGLLLPIFFAAVLLIFILVAVLLAIIIGFIYAWFRRKKQKEHRWPEPLLVGYLLAILLLALQCILLVIFVPGPLAL